MAKATSKKTTRVANKTGIEDLLTFVKKPFGQDKKAWLEEAELVLGSLVDSKDGRYGTDEKYDVNIAARDGRYRQASGVISVRVSKKTTPDKTDKKRPVIWAALLNEAGNNEGAAYGGSSLVFFGSEKYRPLMTFCVGTQGLAPDEKILGTPGHARRLRAICKYINKTHGKGRVVAWAKENPCNTDEPIPNQIATRISQVESVGPNANAAKDNSTTAETPYEKDPDYEQVMKERCNSGYGNVIYAIVNLQLLTDDGVREAACMFMDLFFRARELYVRRDYEKEARNLEALYKGVMFPNLDVDSLWENLQKRRYVIVEGPPGTGKTTLAFDLEEKLSKEDGKNKTIRIQFHPNMTYERFIGGIFPTEDKDSQTGFKFVATEGALIQAISVAQQNPDNKVLLHIDEINRADLARVLGEAIFLFEPSPKFRKPIKLGNKFKCLRSDKVVMPRNLFVLGTMNSADRSIAIMDIAIRRRFAFMSLYPQIGMLAEDKSDDFGRRKFSELVDIFIDHATRDEFKYLPGHSYFMLREGLKSTVDQIRTELIPLLRAYIDDGCVSGFEGEIRAYIDSCECPTETTPINQGNSKEKDERSA